MQRVNCLAPACLELGDIANQHFLAQRAVRLAHLLLLAGQEVIEVLGRAVGLPKDGHHLEDVDVHPLGLDEVQARSRLAPQVLELEALGLEECVDQVKDVETNAPAVDLGKDVADLVEFQLLIQFDV